MDIKPGDKIEVQLGEYKLETFIDEGGVQRFSPFNKMYAALYEVGNIDLNELAVARGRGEISLKDYREFYLSIGYSVSGLVYLSFFEDLEVYNPVWED